MAEPKNILDFPSGGDQGAQGRIPPQAMEIEAAVLGAIPRAVAVDDVADLPPPAALADQQAFSQQGGASPEVVAAVGIAG